MATIQVPIPIGGSKEEYDGWLYNVSQHIDAGDTVEFVDRDNTSVDVNISRIQLDSVGSVCIWGVGYAESSAQLIALSAGVWHVMPGIHGIRADVTESGKGIHVQI